MLFKEVGKQASFPDLSLGRGLQSINNINWSSCIPRNHVDWPIFFIQF